MSHNIDPCLFPEWDRSENPESFFSPPPNLDLENNLPSVLQFSVGSSDIGGTLVSIL
jgi:hypothetical protein